MKVYVEIQDDDGKVVEQQSYDLEVATAIPSTVIATVETVLDDIANLLGPAAWRCRTTKEPA